MILSINEIANRVRTALRIDACAAPLYDDTPDEEKFNRWLRAAIVTAARKAVAGADPAELIGYGRDFSDERVFINDDGSGFVLLPSDYCRLLVFRMSDWHRAVFAPVDASSEAYARSLSPWQGVGANPWRPVCAEVFRSEGRALEFRGSLSSGATIAMAAYAPVPEIDDRDAIDLPERLIQSIINETANAYEYRN